MMTITEKIQNLKLVSEKLKKDFIGIDNVIDKVIKCISPWYLTPELLDRPVVVSLWGMTGIGKTSLVKNLINYLDIKDTSYFFDCGEKSKESGETLTEVLSEIFFGPEYSFGEDEGSTSNSNVRSSVFVFDEFQCARTIDEMGHEVNKPNLRPIWSLIDSGILDINETRYDIISYKNYVEDLASLIEAHPEIKLNNGHFDRQYSTIIKDTLGSIYYDLRDYENNVPTPDELSNSDIEDNNKLYYKSITPRIRKLITNSYNKIKKGLGFEKIKELDSFEFAQDLLKFLKLSKKDICTSKVIDCSKSLIFILGNLDEVYSMHNDVSPEVSADLYNSMTNEIGIPDAKSALQSRFRNEQISRLGNNLIIYPSLKEKDFYKIIDKEISRITDKFNSSLGIKVEISQNFKKLIYSEGVYPSQGVRPVFSTIGNLFTSRLSDVFIEKPEGSDKAVFNLRTNNFDINSINVYIEYYDSSEKLLKSFSYVTNLDLGKMRNVKNNERVLIQSIHEASHAVIYTYLTGKYPTSIISNSALGGGVMYEGFTKSSEITTREEIKNSVMISVAGYLGEKEFFDENMCLMGSSNDLNSAWHCLSEAVYHCGFIDPINYINSTLNEHPSGLDSKKLEQGDLDLEIRKLMNNYVEETKKIISSERELIKEIGIYLSENRTISTRIYKNYISKYSKLMTIDSINKKYKEIFNYYKNKLKEGI